MFEPTAPAPPLAGSLRPGDRLGRFVIEAVVGQGGMGVVYRARDPELDRVVALKVVAARAGRGRDRLLAEARAMARVEHPSIVPVYDVGPAADGVYIAMPLVAGGTLAAWLATRRRPWREVLQRFVAAGRGLAAAHGAGLVHRDFKPQNVLLDDDGAVLVADFGLVAPAPDATADGAAADAPSSQVTTIAGTPAYMAPEQAAGQAVDARADQYSFCISLWEGLHGERPTQAATGHASGEPGVPVVPADRRGAPGWLLAAITRGFAPARERRWPSMTALLDHLERRRRRPRRRAMLMGGVAIGLLVAAVIGTREQLTQDPARRCDAAATSLTAAWSPEVAERVDHALRATGSPIAVEIVERVVPALDRYAATWRSARISACEQARSGRVRAAIVDHRALCLDRRLTELRARVATLLAADTRVVRDAVELVTTLPSVDDCMDDLEMGRLIPLPVDGVQRQTALEFERQLGELRLAAVRAPPSESLRRAKEIAAEAAQRGLEGVYTRALYEQMRALTTSREPLAPLLRELIDVASRSGDDRVAAVAWIRLVQELADLGRFEEAMQLEPAARSAIARVGGERDGALQVSLAMALGAVAGNTGELDRATAYFQDALAAATNPIERIGALRNLGYGTMVKGNHDEARRMLDEGVRLAAEVFGRGHPRYADLLGYRASLYSLGLEPDDRGRAIRDLEAALAIQVQHFGEQNAYTADTLRQLAFTEIERRNWDVAERHVRRSLAILETIEEPLSRPAALLSLAEIVLNKEGLERARPHFDRALADAAAVFGKESIDYTAAAMSLGRALVEARACRAARPLVEHVARTRAGEGGPDEALAAFLLGRCELLDGRRDAGLDRMGAALASCAACTPAELARLRQQLGQALVEARRDRARGLELVTQARDHAVAFGDDAWARELDDWLARR